MAAHRHWRLLFDENETGGSSVSIAEVEMREARGGSDACSGGAASASSVAAPYAAGNAFDNSAATKWASSGFAKGAEWLAYDFGAGVTREIVEVTITSWTSLTIETPTRFRVQSSDDGTTWTTEWRAVKPTSTENQWAVGQTRTFRRPTDAERGASYRYWRLVLNNNGVNNRTQSSAMAEVVLRALPGGADLTSPGGAASASSGTASAAIDDNNTTLWNSTASYWPRWWQYDLGGSPASVKFFDIRGPSTVPTFEPTVLDLVASNDAAAWVHVAGAEGLTWAGSETKSFAGAPGVALTSVSPPAEAAGTPVTLVGSGFLSGSPASVTFGGVAATSVVVVDDTHITCTAPAHALGAVDVVVTIGSSPATLAGGFTYLAGFRVDSVAPGSVYLAGAEVTLTGRGFTGTDHVLFGVAWAYPTSVTDTEIVVTAPAMPDAGAVDVQVVLAGGATAALADGLTYQDHAVTSVSPVALTQAGGVLQVSGRWFLGVAVVLVDGSPVSTAYVSATRLDATIPADLPLGYHRVAVSNGLRGDTPEMADAFRTLAPESSGAAVLFVVT